MATRISHYISIPLLVVVAIATASWLYSNAEAEKIRLLEAGNQVHANHAVSFSHFSSGFSSLLIQADLIIGNNQEFLIQNYLSQSGSLIDELSKLRGAENLCCAKENLLNLQHNLISMERSIVRTSMGAHNDANQNDLLASLDHAARRALSDIDIISSAISAHSKKINDRLKIKSNGYRDVLLLTWALGAMSIFIAWIHISRTITKPIISLSKAAEDALKNKAFTLPSQESGPQEIMGLRNSLGRLTEHLDAEIESEKEKIKNQERVSSAKLWELAHIDPLTKIANRSLFNQHFATLLAHHSYEQEEFSVCIIDVNEFKLVNDTLGHISGDRLLIELGKVLNSFLNKESIACRLGGDEFGLLIKPGISDKEDGKFFGQIISACEKISFSNEGNSGAQISIGIAGFPEHGTDMKALMMAADTAMFESKQRRLNESSWLRFNPGMDAGRIRLARIKNEIEQALLRNEFCLHFQPIIDGRTKAIVSAESLLRWPSGPKDVSIPEVIDIAEKSGLILKLGEKILNQACEAISTLKDKGIPITLAVNISAIQFRYQNLTEIIKEKTELYDFPPDKLIIEITESSFIDNINRTKKMLSEMKSVGIGIAIDDFGTGYSSLSYLQKLEVDWVKIDKSFISGEEASNNPALLKAIISMAHAMDAGLVAEGVEDAHQLDNLNSLGCERVQGYFFSKPLPAEEFLSLLDSAYPLSKENSSNAIDNTTN